MNHSLESLGITLLSVDERLELIGAIWDSIANSDSHHQLPDWHQDTLDERLARADQNPEASIRWEDLKTELRQS